MPDPEHIPAATVLKRFAWLALITAFFTYALIVFGGVVRITGSGMGCGDDWPLCNGRLIPPMDLETLIEYGHRLAAALVSVLVFLVAGYAFRHRRDPHLARRGTVGLALTAAILLIVQVLVGAVTVRLELPTSTVVLHLGLASALLAVLVLAGLRGLVEAAPSLGSEGTTRLSWPLIAVILGFVVLVLGALVANSGAAPLCRGFPLCNGRLLPRGGGLVYLHWTHRLLAYAEFVVVALGVLDAHRRRVSAPTFVSALVALALVVAQVAVGAVMVLQTLPAWLRGLHLAVGVALWAALVVWAELAGRFQLAVPARSALFAGTAPPYEARASRDS